MLFKIRLLFSLTFVLVFFPSFAAQWCGGDIEFKRKCFQDGEEWTVQMNLFSTDPEIKWGNDDCISTVECVASAQWTWSDPGAWSQLFLSKDGFCNKGFSIANTREFNVSFDGNFANGVDNHRLAIVSWGKTADNCDWTTDNLYELYIHEKSFNEGTHSQAYSWCNYKGTSEECSGSTYELYDCEFKILGRSIRCWRNEPRTKGTTDVNCLWKAWQDEGTAPEELYYYFTEVGSEVGPESSGRFNLTGHDMVRIDIDDEIEEEEEIVASLKDDLLIVKGKQFSSVELYSLNGKFQGALSVLGNQYELSTIDFTPGLYVLRFLFHDGSLGTEKIVLR